MICYYEQPDFAFMEASSCLDRVAASIPPCAPTLYKKKSENKNRRKSLSETAKLTA